MIMNPFGFGYRIQISREDRPLKQVHNIIKSMSSLCFRNHERLIDEDLMMEPNESNGNILLMTGKWEQNFIIYFTYVFIPSAMRLHFLTRVSLIPLPLKAF